MSNVLARLNLSLRIVRKRRVRRKIKKIKLPEFGKKPQYLIDYIEKIKKEIGEEPLVVDKLTGDMKTWKTFSIIYPVGGGVFIHAYSPPEGTETGYSRYIVIEPPRPSTRLFRLLEEALAAKIKPYHIAESAEEKKRLLLELIEEITEVSEKPVKYDEIRLRNSHVLVYKGDIDYVKYHLIRDKIGVGILEPFLRDPYIEDISCRGVGSIYIVHKIFGSMESNLGFKNEEDLDEFIIKLGEKIGKPISRARPVVDATLPDGSRINIVYGNDVSLHGSNFTIRRVAKIPISVIQLIKWGTFDEYIAAYMWMMLSEGMSAFICGETASGKTTTLNAISTFIRPNYKIVTIEDTAEVVLPHPNWVRELTRDTGKAESSVTMFDLLKAALRQRPNYIIVGEIRGIEGNIAFQAMQSVSWDTVIMIRRSKSKEAEIVYIGEFIDKFYREEEEKIPKFISGYEVLTMDKNGRIVWARIKYVLRHKVDRLYRVIYEGGGSIKVTGTHSVFVLDENNLIIKPKSVNRLNKGDLLISFTCNSFKNNKIYKNTEHQNKIRDLIPKLTPTNKIQCHKKNTISSRYKIVLNNKNRAVQVIWILKLLGFEPSLINNKEHSYEIEINNDNLSPNNRIPAKPIIELIERNNLTHEIRSAAPEIYDLLYRVNTRFITKDDAKRIMCLLKKHIDILSNYDKELLMRLALLINSDIAIIRIIDIEKISYQGFVYDVSVPETELFLGGEYPIALHNTGHPVLSTFHAANLERLIQRLTNPPINVPKTNMDSLNIAWFQSAVYSKTGLLVRRVITVNEIVGYDPESDAISAIPVFTWDPSTDRFRFAGRGASYLLEEKIAVMRGISRRDIKLIYEELDLRARFLKLLVEKNIVDYSKVFKAIVKTYQLGLEEAYRKLRNDTLL